MAGNKVDAIFASEAIAQIIKVKQELALADAELINLSQNASKASASIRGISSPSGLDKTVTDTTQLNAELERQNKIIQGLETQIKRLSQVRATNNKMSAEEAVNQRILNKNALDQAKAVSSLVGAYDKLNLAHQKAFKNAQNIGAQYGVTSDKFLKASEKANKLDAELKTLDATLGKHNRNVGNYASGYNALGNSINQLSREAPAFANSINTGFMAISNNIPALTDAIRGIRAENKALAAEGKPTVSVLKQLAGAIFSWQTLISVGVTLLTLYGGKLIDLAFGATKAEKAQQALNEEMKNAKNSISSEATQLQSLTNIVLDHNESSINRKLAYDEIKKTLPGLTSATYEQAISTGELTRATNLYISSLVQKNIVEAEAKSIAEQQTELNKETSKSYKEQIGTVEAFLQSLQPERQRKNIEKSMKAQIKAEQDAQQQIIDNRKKALVKAQEDYLKTQEQLKPYIETTKKAKKAKEEESEALKGTEKWYEQQIAKLKEIQSTTADTTAEYKAFTAQIELLEKALKLLKSGGAFKKPELADTSSEIIPSISIEDKSSENPNEWMKQYAKDVEDAKKQTEQLQQATDNFLKSFSTEFLQNSGLGSLETFFDGTFDKLLEGAQSTEEKFAVTFNAIAESAQEMFNFISNASQANFDAEYARLESQKDEALKFAGDSAASKKKIEEEAEKKKKEIAAREFKAKQKQAIFNIAIDTAQAIVSTYAQVPKFDFGVSATTLALIIGGIGAAQIGMVAAQKIPQYFDGGVHGGGLAMINDAGGSNYVETVVTPDGKVQQFKGRDVVTDLPKGTEIFTPEQWQQKELEYMLNSRGVMLNNQASKGFTAEQMDAILAKHFGKIQTNTTVFDKKGIMHFSEMNGNKTIRNANRATGLGFKV